GPAAGVVHARGGNVVVNRPFLRHGVAVAAVHIHLTQDHLDAEICKPFQVLSEVGGGGCVREGAKMHLHADAVDGDATLNHAAYHVVDGVRLIVHALDAEIVVEEQDVCIRLARRLEGRVDVGGSEVLKEDIVGHRGGAHARLVGRLPGFV